MMKTPTMIRFVVSILFMMLLALNRHNNTNNVQEEEEEENANNNHIRRRLDNNKPNKNNNSLFDPRTVVKKLLFGTSKSNKESSLSSPTNNNRQYPGDDHDFREMAGLMAIITGLDQAGTSVLANFLYNAPCIMGAYETGYLLAESPSNIHKLHPVYEWNSSNLPFTTTKEEEEEQLLHTNKNNQRQRQRQRQPQLNYNLTQEDYEKMMKAKTFANMYQILRHQSPLFSRNHVVDSMECEVPYQIIDKSPSYVYPEYLEDVILKTPMVPIFVVDKGSSSSSSTTTTTVETLSDPTMINNHNNNNNNGDLSSRTVQTPPSITTMTSGRTKATQDNIRAMIQKYPNRHIQIIYDHDLMTQPEVIMPQVFTTLGLEWKSEYLEMTGLVSKLQHFPDRVKAEVAPWNYDTTKIQQQDQQQQQPVEVVP